jgi:hypothetical protein
MMRRRFHRYQTADDMASCRAVARVLQGYLDGAVDEMTARRVALHLEACRRCGLEAHTYQELKRALARRSAHVDRLALERLRGFALHLLEYPPAVAG